MTKTEIFNKEAAMGNQQDYIESGGFSQYLYKDHYGFSAKEVNGVRGKVVLDQRDPNGQHYSLPSYANSSDMYFKVSKGGEVIQGRLYIDRKSVLDFDWGHTHTNKSDGKTFTKGTIHVQVYSVDSNGKPTRHSDSARHMTNAEIKKYGSLIKAYNPNVKFR